VIAGYRRDEDVQSLRYNNKRICIFVSRLKISSDLFGSLSLSLSLSLSFKARNNSFQRQARKTKADMFRETQNKNFNCTAKNVAFVSREPPDRNNSPSRLELREPCVARHCNDVTRGELQVSRSHHRYLQSLFIITLFFSREKDATAFNTREKERERERGVRIRSSSRACIGPLSNIMYPA